MNRALKEKGNRIQNEIREVLYRNWDPIGVSGDSPDDEYDSYIGGVYRVLTGTRSISDLTEYLHLVEKERIGVVPSERKSLVPIAELLLAIEV